MLSFGREWADHGAIGAYPTGITPVVRAESRACRARQAASGERAEPDRGSDHGIRRIDVVRLHPYCLVRLLDRARCREVPYGLLTMIVSLEAIFLSTFVMIS